MMGDVRILIVRRIENFYSDHRAHTDKIHVHISFLKTSIGNLLLATSQKEIILVKLNEIGPPTCTKSLDVISYMDI